MKGFKMRAVNIGRGNAILYNIRWLVELRKLGLTGNEVQLTTQFPWDWESFYDYPHQTFDKLIEEERQKKRQVDRSKKSKNSFR